MSGNISSPVSPVPPTVTQAITKAYNTTTLMTNMAQVAQSDAKAIPTLVNNLASLDPTLVAPVQAKALLASKTPIGVALAGLISYGVTKYGLGWTPDIVSLVSGLVVLLASYGMRYITSAPIKGFFSAK